MSRLAFICNVFFLGAMAARIFMHLDEAQELGLFGNTVVIMGLVLSPIINMGVNLWYLLLLLGKKQVTGPLWLRLFNVFILIGQLFFYIILPA